MASYERLSALDRFFLDVESSNTHMHVAAVMLFEAGPLRNSSGGVDIDRVRKHRLVRLTWTQCRAALREARDGTV